MKQGSPTPFHRAIRKYGMDAFEFYVLNECSTFQEACRLEREYIAEHAPEYNMTRGGDGAMGYRHTDEAKQVMSEKKRGRPSHMVGKTHSEETRKKLSAALKGKPSFWKGKKVPDHVHAARKAAFEVWQRNKDAVRAALEPARQATRRKVVCLNDGCVFDSITAAALKYDLDHSSITEVCKNRGPRRMAGGLVFRYFGEHYGGKDEAERVALDVLASRRRTASIARKSLMRAVLCVDDGKVFPSVTAAAAFYGARPSRVCDVCEGRTGAPRYAHRAAGRRFRYAEAPDGV